jgi:hypothetical protein
MAASTRLAAALSSLVACAKDGAPPATTAGDVIAATSSQRVNLDEGILRIDLEVRR